MTLRERIVAHLAAHPGVEMTNAELSAALSVPEPSIRRATLKAVSTFPATIVDAGGSGAARSPYRYRAIYPQSADATGVPA
jgi:hypothetical protein